MNQTEQRNNIYKNPEHKEGFLIQTDKDQYLWAKGPFSRSFKPAKNKWSLFHPPFFLSESLSANWYIPSAVAFFSKRELLDLLKNQIKSVEINISDLCWKPPCFSDFENFFLKALRQINPITQSKLKKVVPVFFETAKYVLKEQDILHWIYRLVSGAVSSMGYAYAFWSGKQAIIGLTPEWLFKKNGLLFQTMALAGTAQDPKQDLLTDPKERKEHQIVVEELKTSLSKVGESEFSDTYVSKVRNLTHLRTDFKLQLKKDISFKELCFILHPTPALGGVPKKKALDLLAKLDQSQPRYNFGAPFGVTKGKKAFCMVAIRNIQFRENRAYIGSGVGLIKESQIDREWQELKKKRQVIKDILF